MSYDDEPWVHAITREELLKAREGQKPMILPRRFKDSAWGDDEEPPVWEALRMGWFE